MIRPIAFAREPTGARGSNADSPPASSMDPTDDTVSSAGWRSPFIFLVGVCGLLLLGAIVAGTGGLLSKLHDRALDGKKQELQSLSAAAADQVNRTFQAIELVQNSYIERTRELGISARSDFERHMSGLAVHRKLKDITSGLPFVAVICLTNLDGKLINFSRSWPIEDPNVSQRDYVRALTSDPQTISFVSKPLRNPTTGVWTIYLARKVIAADGEVLGLIGAGVELNYFQEVFSSVLLEQSSSISLFRNDGVLLVRYPDIGGTIGNTYTAFADALRDGKDRGAVRIVGRMDGRDRILGVQRARNFPLVIAVGLDAAVALADWRSLAFYIVGAALLAIGVIASGMALIAWQVTNSFRLQNRRFSAALSNMSHGLCMFDAKQRLLVANNDYARLYGLPPEKVKPGTSFRQIIEHRISMGMYAGENPEEYIRERLAAVSNKTADTRVHELPDGRFVAIKHKPMEGGGWVATHEDVTELHALNRELERRNEVLGQNERALGTRNAQFDAALNNMVQGLIMFDAESRLVVANNRYAEIYGLPSDKLMPGTASADIVGLGRALGIFNEIWIKSIEELRCDCLDLGQQSPRQPLARKVELDDGRVIEIKIQALGSGGWVATHEDVTEERLAETKILHLARHDALTDLPNRAFLAERLETALTQIRRGENLALHFIDLDHFKTANDTLGHAVGDKLLQAVAERLGNITRETDTVARLGGDEFAIVQVGTEAIEDVVYLAQRLIASISEPYEFDDHQIVVGASIGIALAPADGDTADQLLRNADLALYRAKENGRGTYHFFEPHLDERMQRRRALEGDLRKALVAGQLELYYQPVIALDKMKTIGAEALIRWQHPERGTISPAAFIPLAEDMGLIVSIGEWVIRRACETAAGWPNDVKVAVNLSSVQFRRPGLVHIVANALAATKLAPHRLELEITESLLLDASESTISTLHQLRTLGVSIALDDFGTGYSSLSYLQSFPFDKIKIDRSFTRDLAMQGAHDIIRAMVTLASALNMSITAEGVENEEQLALLRDMGCAQGQGYFFSPPRPADEIARLLLSSYEVVESAA